jgi:UDP-GlcNAc3NAcA epimerase
MQTPDDIVISVVGARPHFIKVFPLVKAMAGRKTRHFILHTGQHYDDSMSKVFFEQLGMPAADINLNIGSGSHAEQTAKVMIGVERLVREMRPKAILVYGDTNSTLGATLAAAKHYYPVVHVEAGVRCGNRRMPEEINRKLIDHASDYLVCPSDLAVENLRGEGVTAGVLNLGDFMYDSFLAVKTLAVSRPGLLEAHRVESGRFILSTIHREAATDDPKVLFGLLQALAALDEPVILPLHPRSRARLAASGFTAQSFGSLRLIEPLGYLDMMHLLLHARRVVTDSGGLQKEAYWAGVPCVTLMNETTWTETISAGWNRLIGLDGASIASAIQTPAPTGARPDVYGAPGSAARLVEALGWN